MRVTGPSPQFNIAPAKVKKTGEADGEFEVLEQAEASAAKPAAKTASASSLGALIAAQLHVEDDELDRRRKKRRKNVERGRDVLQVLDDIKLDMLAGKLSLAQLTKLAEGIVARERDSDDPQLEAILDEVYLRARVEQAKFKRSGGG